MADVLVQRGVTDFGASANTATATITSVSSLTKAFVRITNIMHTSAGKANGISGDTNVDDIGVTCLLTAVDTVTLTRESSGAAADYRVYWEVWEYTGADSGPNEFLVRHQAEISQGTNAQVDTTLATQPDDETKCVPFVTGQRSTNTGLRWGRAMATAKIIDDSGTIKVRTDVSASSNATVSVAVVEFTGSNWSVQQNIEHSYSAADTDETETISDVGSWATAFVVGSARCTSTISGDLSEETVCCFRPGATTTAVRFHVGDIDRSPVSVVHVVKNASLVVGHYDSITGGDADIGDATTSPAVRNRTITAVAALATTGVIASGKNDVASANANITFHNYRLTSTTNLEFWTSINSSSTQEWAAQVIAFDGLAPSIAGTDYYYKHRRRS